MIFDCVYEPGKDPVPTFTAKSSVNFAATIKGKVEGVIDIYFAEIKVSASAEAKLSTGIQGIASASYEDDAIYLSSQLRFNGLKLEWFTKVEASIAYDIDSDDGSDESNPRKVESGESPEKEELVIIDPILYPKDDKGKLPKYKIDLANFM